MSRKNIFKWCLIIIVLVSPVVFAVSISSLRENYLETEERLDRLEDMLDVKLNRADSERIEQAIKEGDITITDFIRKRNSFIDKPYKPLATTSIPIKVGNNEYEFTDLEMTCSEFSCDNDFWYVYGISPYISPGVEYDMFLRGDKNDEHYIKMQMLNRTKEDVSASDCSVVGMAVNGVEGITIGNISIGDDIEDVIIANGMPDEFSISEYDKITGVVYYYDNYTLRACTSTIRSEVMYIEVTCNKTRGYSNGVWR